MCSEELCSFSKVLHFCWRKLWKKLSKNFGEHFLRKMWLTFDWLLQVTSPYAYIFIALHHNATALEEAVVHPIKYTIGWKDACAVFFYFLITIVMHAVVQEYVFDVSFREKYKKKRILPFRSTLGPTWKHCFKELFRSNTF